MSIGTATNTKNYQYRILQYSLEFIINHAYSTWQLHVLDRVYHKYGSTFKYEVHTVDVQQRKCQNFIKLDAQLRRSW